MAQDGGYHVPVAHPDLAAALDLTTYSSKIYRTSSVQSCRAKGAPEARLGEHNTADSPAEGCAHIARPMCERYVSAHRTCG